MIIDGKKTASEILAELKKLPKPKKFLAAILAGDDPSSISFIKQKEKVAKELGVDFRLYKLPASITTDDLRREIGRLAGASTCGGCIVQLPLPTHINRRYVLNAIPREKDVDVLSEKATVAFSRSESLISPPPVAVVEEIVKRQKINLQESEVLVIGAGVLVGKPIGDWLRGKVKHLAVVDERSGDFGNELSRADIVISGVGKAGLFGAKDIKDGALAIDFGYEGGRGDFDPENLEIEKSQLSARGGSAFSGKIYSYTPTPGGTGPILVAKLFENFYTLNSG